MSEPAGTAQRGPAVVGRAALLERLGAVVDAARGGDGTALCLVGPPGIGKTTIADALVAGADPVTVLAGRCPPPPVRPLRPLSELTVAALGAGARLEPVDDTVFGAGVRTLLGDQLGDGVSRPAPVLGEGLRLLAGQIDGLVVWRLEDLHWADAETLSVVDDLVEHVSGAPHVLVTTARPHASERVDLVVADWMRRGVAEAVPVSPLLDDEIATVVRDVGGEAVSPRRVDQIVAASEGNPLVASAFARDARDLGPGRHPARLPVPDSYRAAVERRLREVPQRAHIGLAALIGRVVEPSVLERCGLDPADVAAAGAAAVRAQLAVPDRESGGIRFDHDLTRDAIVDLLDEPERTRLAGDAVARLLDGDLHGDVLDAAARLAGIAGEDALAVELLLDGARRALAMGATATALARLDQVAGSAETAAVHGPVLAELRLEALALAGRAKDALALGEPLVAEHEFRDDPERRRRLALALARASGSLADWAAAAEHLDVLGADGAAEVRSFRAVVAMELGDVSLASKLASDVLDDADAPPVAVCEAREVLGRVARERDYADAAVHFRAGVAAATEAGLGLWKARSLLELGLCEATLNGSPDMFAAASSSARRIGAVGLSAMCDYNLANLLGIIIRPRESLEVAERGLASARQVEIPILQALCWAVVGQAHAELGNAGEARHAADEARRADPDSPEVEGLALGMCQGFAALMRGDLHASAEIYAEAFEVLGALPVVTATTPWYFGSIAVAAVDHDVLPAVRARLGTAPFRAIPTMAATAALVDLLVAGRSGDAAALDAAADALEAARRPHRWFADDGAGLWAFLDGVAAVAALGGGWGDPVPALERARGEAEGRGLVPAARWFAATLREAGSGPRRRGRARADIPSAYAEYGVTAREYEVLQLVAQRLTNREIATQLVVAPSTVKTHVERLLAKTGRADRRELADLAAVLDGE